jgi:hypothetical protein
MMKLLTRLFLTIMTLITLIGNTPQAFAQDPAGGQPRLRGIRGEVTAVNENSLTLATRNGNTITVNVTANTVIRLFPSGEEGSLVDIKIGNFAGVRGQRSGDNVVEARLILVLPKDPKDMARARGKVTGIEDNIITVENPQGSRQITTTPETVFRVGQEKAGLEDIKVGNRLLALGAEADDGSFIAQLVIVPPGAQHRPHRLRGEITGISGTSFTLSARRGEFTVLTDDATQYLTRGDQEVSFDDLEVGSRVVVIGKPVEGQEKTIQAKLVGIRAK